MSVALKSQITIIFIKFEITLIVRIVAINVFKLKDKRNNVKYT
jgi:hypothetical protein